MLRPFISPRVAARYSRLQRISMAWALHNIATRLEIVSGLTAWQRDSASRTKTVRCFYRIFYIWFFTVMLCDSFLQEKTAVEIVKLRAPACCWPFRGSPLRAGRVPCSMDRTPQKWSLGSFLQGPNFSSRSLPVAAFPSQIVTRKLVCYGRPIVSYHFSTSTMLC